MSLVKDELLRTIEIAPEAAIEQTLIYLKSLLQSHSSLRLGSGRSLLRHAEKWQGDDFETCLRSVYDTRTEAQF